MNGVTTLDTHFDARQPAFPGRLHHRRLDEEGSNLVASWARIGRGADWPNAGQWDELAARDMLQELGPVREVRSSGGRLELGSA